MTFSHFSLKKNKKQKLANKLIVLPIFCHFFQKIIKSIKNLFSNIVPSSMAKCEEKCDKSLPTMSEKFSAKLCILPNGNPQNCAKTTNQN